MVWIRTDKIIENAPDPCACMFFLDTKFGTETNNSQLENRPHFFENEISRKQNLRNVKLKSIEYNIPFSWCPWCTASWTTWKWLPRQWNDMSGSITLESVIFYTSMFGGTGFLGVRWYITLFHVVRNRPRSELNFALSTSNKALFSRAHLSWICKWLQWDCSSRDSKIRSARRLFSGVRVSRSYSQSSWTIWTNSFWVEPSIQR